MASARGGTARLKPKSVGRTRTMRLQMPMLFLSLLGAFSCAHVFPSTRGLLDQEVRAMDDLRVHALLRGDIGVLNDIYSDDYTLITPTGVVRTKTDQLAELRSRQIRYETITVLERVVRTYGDTAVVLSRDVSVIWRGTRQVGGDLRFTRV